MLPFRSEEGTSELVSNMWSKKLEYRIRNMELDSGVKTDQNGR